MSHIFFIHSSVGGHSGCLHVFTIVNSAAMNTGVYVPGGSVVEYPPASAGDVGSLAQEDPTCCGATKPVHHNYWAHALELVLYSRSHHNEKLAHCNKV